MSKKRRTTQWVHHISNTETHGLRSSPPLPGLDPL